MRHSALYMPPTPTPRALLAEHDLVVVDLETTGLHANRHDRVLEVAAVRYRSGVGVVDAFETLVNPHRDVGPTSIHKITASDLVDAPTFGEIAGRLLEIMEGAVIVAHNARFDLSFLEREFARVGVILPPLATLCTVSLPARVGLQAPRRSLSVLCKTFGLPYEEEAAHGAMHDARAALALLCHCIDHAAEKHPVTMAELGCVEVPPTPWPALPYEGHALTRAVALAGTHRARTFGRLDLSGAIPEQTGATTLSVPARRAYFALLDHMLEDQHVTREEREELLQWAEEEGVSASALRAANHAYLTRLSGAARRGEAARLELRSVAGWLGIDEATVGRLLSRPPAHTTEPFASLRGLSVCFSGELRCHMSGRRISRSMAERAASRAGLHIRHSVTRALDILVLADIHSQSTKARTARRYGTRIIAESTFWRLAGIMVD